MKTFIQVLKFSCLVMLCSVFILACKKGEPDANPGPGTPTDTTTVEDVNNVSDHLQFLGSTKKQGKIPAAPAGGSSLKISIKDTLYLVEGMKIPVKFLHQDTTKNVAGVYVQVHGLFIGSTGGPLDATHYYDVPELTETAENDTVSVILIGFDPTDFKFPLSFTVTITPYDPSGQPLDVTEVPVTVVELKDDPKKSGNCGLVLPDGDFWAWDLSYILTDPYDGTFSFYSDPRVIFGKGGQNIKGCCVNGVSDYGATCLQKDSIYEKRLHFSTYYQIRSETFTFYDNGTFLRQTFEGTANPFPDESDFCGSGPGVVHEKLNHTVYNGNWTMNKMTVPPDLKPYYDTRNYLTLQTTSSTGGGYGNPGGIVHQLDCRIGVLALIQLDREGFGQHLYKFYYRVSPGDLPWYPF